MRRRDRAYGVVEADRLRSSDPGDWLLPAERVAVVELVDAERELPPTPIGTAPELSALDRLHALAGFTARMVEDRDEAIRLVENLVVDHRRKIAGARLAASSLTRPSVIADQFGLGQLTDLNFDGPYWLATDDFSKLGA